jgi:hypothetical protein
LVVGLASRQGKELEARSYLEGLVGVSVFADESADVRRDFEGLDYGLPS